MTTIPLTRDFKETLNARVQRDSAFAAALLDEAISLFLNGEPETARLILRDLAFIECSLQKEILQWIISPLFSKSCVKPFKSISKYRLLLALKISAIEISVRSSNLFDS